MSERWTRLKVLSLVCAIAALFFEWQLLQRDDWLGMGFGVLVGVAVWAQYCGDRRPR